ncbi:ribosomal maturation YjgA family protein [Yeosuana marina]|uniref:ribosomal maturation YjgA family protein n=1 Tax=Yeosuana marina TaxID=1565536 RepID=UPI0037444B18
MVILIYCFFKSFIPNNHFKIAMLVLAFAFLIEFLQLVNILEMFNLQNNHLVKLILGSTFQISDVVAYTLGILTVIIFELKLKNEN